MVNHDHRRRAGAVLGGLLCLVSMVSLAVWTQPMEQAVGLNAAEIRHVAPIPVEPTRASVEGEEADAEVEIGDRVVDLPEDGRGRGYFTTVFTSSNWQRNGRERAIVEWFRENGRLTDLRRQTHWHHYTPGHRIWSRFRKVLDRLPCVVVQDPDGYVIYKATGENVPSNEDELADEIARMLTNRYAQRVDQQRLVGRRTPVRNVLRVVFRNRPSPQPAPSPSPPPVCPGPDCPDEPPVDPASDMTIPDIRPETTTNDGVPWLALLTTSGLSGVGTLLWKLRQEADL